jgi:hypothetical protein
MTAVAERRSHSDHEMICKGCGEVKTLHISEKCIRCRANMTCKECGIGFVSRGKQKQTRCKPCRGRRSK